MHLSPELKALYVQIKKPLYRAFTNYRLAGDCIEKSYLKACKRCKQKPSKSPRQSGNRIDKSVYVLAFLSAYNNVNTKTQDPHNKQSVSNQKVSKKATVTPLKVFTNKSKQKAVDPVQQDLSIAEQLIELKNTIKDRNFKREFLFENALLSRITGQMSASNSAIAELNKMDNDYGLEEDTHTGEPMTIVYGVREPVKELRITRGKPRTKT